MAKYGKESRKTQERETYDDGVRVLEARIKNDSEKAWNKVYGKKDTSKFSTELIGENTGRKRVGKKSARGGVHKEGMSTVGGKKRVARKK